MLRLRQQIGLGRAVDRRGSTFSRRATAAPARVPVAFADRNRSMTVDAIDAARNTPNSKVATTTKPQDARWRRKYKTPLETPPVPLPQVMIGCAELAARLDG